MKLEKAIEILEAHNKWRVGKHEKHNMQKPSEITEAIDTVIDAVKNIAVLDGVVGRSEQLADKEEKCCGRCIRGLDVCIYDDDYNE